MLGIGDDSFSHSGGAIRRILKQRNYSRAVGASARLWMAEAARCHGVVLAYLEWVGQEI